MTWLACRRHILEVMLVAVVLLSVGPSKSPDIMTFKRFQGKSSIIDKARYQAALSNDVTCNCVSDIDKDMIAFSENQLRELQPSDDFKELLN